MCFLVIFDFAESKPENVMRGTKKTDVSIFSTIYFNQTNCFLLFKIV